MSTQKVVGYLVWAIIMSCLIALGVLCFVGISMSGCSQQRTSTQASSSIPPVPKILMHEYEAPRHQWLEIVGPTTVDEGEHVRLESFLRSIIMGDANGDGLVNLRDYMRLEVNWGRTGMKWRDGDFTHDGKVDMDDYMILERNYGQEK